MASLKDIRRRISSVKNTRQITKAMKMVAASRLRKAQEMIQGARPFAEKIEEITLRLLSTLDERMASLSDEKRAELLSEIHPLLKDPSTNIDQSKERLAFLVVASDKGLCGGYNTNVLKFAWKRFEELRQDENREIQLFFVGRRAKDYFGKKGFEGTFFEDFWTGVFNSQRSDPVAKQFIDLFLEGKADRVEVVYTEFKSALTQTPSVKQLLPLIQNTDAIETESVKESTEESLPTIYKPGEKKLLENLLPKQVQTQFFKVFADSVASEVGARMTAMDSATRNASDMIDKLTLEANRVRQAAITTELMEIVSGAEALKG